MRKSRPKAGGRAKVAARGVKGSLTVLGRCGGAAVRRGPCNMLGPYSAAIGSAAASNALSTFGGDMG